MPEHRFSVNDKEADLLAEVISHSLRGLPMMFGPESRAYLINLKRALTRRRIGRRKIGPLVEGAPVTRLEV